MRGRLLVCLLALALPGAALASTSVGVSVSIGNAPPPPVIVFHRAPRLVMVPNSTVYVMDADDDEAPCDMFRYGLFWYAYNDNYWYRARTYRGPFVAVEARYVPRAILSVPARHWRHIPPGHLRSDDDYYVVREHGHGHGHGHGKHHDDD